MSKHFDAFCREAAFSNESVYSMVPAFSKVDGQAKGCVLLGTSRRVVAYTDSNQFPFVLEMPYSSIEAVDVKAMEGKYREMEVLGNGHTFKLYVDCAEDEKVQEFLRVVNAGRKGQLKNRPNQSAQFHESRPTKQSSNLGQKGFGDLSGWYKFAIIFIPFPFAFTVLTDTYRRELRIGAGAWGGFHLFAVVLMCAGVATAPSNSSSQQHTTQQRQQSTLAPKPKPDTNVHLDKAEKAVALINDDNCLVDRALMDACANTFRTTAAAVNLAMMAVGPQEIERAQNLARDTIELQRDILPKLRDALGPAMREHMRNAGLDANIRTVGRGYRVFEFTHESITNHERGWELYRDILPTLQLYRFEEAQYKRSRRQSDYLRVEVISPADDEIAFRTPSGRWEVVNLSQ